MKKKSAQKLHLGKIRIANLSVAIQQSVKGKGPYPARISLHLQLAD